MHDVVPKVCEVLPSTLGSQSNKNKPGTNKHHPIEVHLLHPQQRGLLSFICELLIKQPNGVHGLVGFKGGSKNLSVLKTAASETYIGRRISRSYQPRSIFGLQKVC